MRILQTTIDKNVHFPCFTVVISRSCNRRGFSGGGRSARRGGSRRSDRGGGGCCPGSARSCAGGPTRGSTPAVGSHRAAARSSWARRRTTSSVARLSGRPSRDCSGPPNAGPSPKANHTNCCRSGCGNHSWRCPVPSRWGGTTSSGGRVRSRRRSRSSLLTITHL